MSKYFEQSLGELLTYYEAQEIFLPESVRSLIKETHKALRAVNILSDKGYNLQIVNLKKWTLKHFPDINKEKDIYLDDYFGTLCACDIYYLSSLVLKLIENKKTGIDPFSVLEEVKKNRIRLEKLQAPKLLTKADREKFPELTDAQWETKCATLNHEALLHYEYQKKLYTDFLAVMYAHFIKIFPEVKNFNAEDTRVFNEFLENAFLVVYRFADRLNKTIAYGFKLDYCEKTEQVLEKAISRCSKKKQAEVKENELRRWKG